MARLFIFAVGGTGARVIKSLTFLLASGIKPSTEKRYEIVPIMIDPHRENKDLQRTLHIMDRYKKIKTILKDSSHFFSVPIETLDQYLDANDQKGGGFSYDLGEVSRSRFRDYIGFDKMSEPNKLLMDFLFSGKSIDKYGKEIGLLDVDMDIGFVGNPNVGSVVLNQFRESQELRQFANIFNEDDRIFIISSIFGGTGAAGFPCILKNIRDAKNIDDINNKDRLENARIGAITVLPYFNVTAFEDSPVQASQFIAKTKAALHYYERNVNSSVNMLYYIADQAEKPYENDPGDNGQQNDAHPVEVFAATAIIDFLETDDQALQTIKGRVIDPVVKEFGLKKNTPSVSINDLGDEMQRKTGFHLSAFMLFRKYLREELPRSIGTNAWCITPPSIGSSFTNSTFFRNHLGEFLSYYDDWVQELAMNKRAFEPACFSEPLNLFIPGFEPEKGIGKRKADYHSFNDLMNKRSEKINYSSAEEKFIDLFGKATEDFLIKHYIHLKK